LKSANEGGREAQPREGSTFWVRSNSDERTEEAAYDAGSTGDGKIMKPCEDLCVRRGPTEPR